MGLLDQLLGSVLAGQRGQAQSGGGLGGLGDLLSGMGGGQRSGASLVTALLPVVLMMLQNRGGAAGGSRSDASGGLDGLLKQFQGAGFGQQADSWVSTGANMPISAEDLTNVFGRDQVDAIARQAGVSEVEASGGLAALLPELVNQLTPQGALPAQGATDDALSELRRSLGM
jgi:uncharacterized protein YidB (DUF937 family)